MNNFGNPLLSDDMIAKNGIRTRSAESFTAVGAYLKTAVLFGVLMTCGILFGMHAHQMIAEAAPAVAQAEGQMKQIGDIPGQVTFYVLAGCLAGFILAMIIIFNNTSAPFLSIPYTALEGMSLGGITAIFEYMYPGIAWQAVSASVGIFVVVYLLYAAKILKNSPGFTKFLLISMLGILAVYLVDIIAAVFFGANVPFLHETGWAGIGISLFICGIAALNFVLDFDFIDKAEAGQLPKNLEWYAAFGIMVTFVWLYLEILRLLAKIRK